MTPNFQKERAREEALLQEAKRWTEAKIKARLDKVHRTKQYRYRSGAGVFSVVLPLHYFKFSHQLFASRTDQRILTVECHTSSIEVRHSDPNDWGPPPTASFWQRITDLF